MDPKMNREWFKWIANGSRMESKWIPKWVLNRSSACLPPFQHQGASGITQGAPGTQKLAKVWGSASGGDIGKICPAPGWICLFGIGLQKVTHKCGIGIKNDGGTQSASRTPSHFLGTTLGLLLKRPYSNPIAVPTVKEKGKETVTCHIKKRIAKQSQGWHAASCMHEPHCKNHRTKVRPQHSGP